MQENRRPIDTETTDVINDVVARAQEKMNANAVMFYNLLVLVDQLRESLRKAAESNKNLANQNAELKEELHKTRVEFSEELLKLGQAGQVLNAKAAVLGAVRRSGNGDELLRTTLEKVAPVSDGVKSTPFDLFYSKAFDIVQKLAVNNVLDPRAAFINAHVEKATGEELQKLFFEKEINIFVDSVSEKQRFVFSCFTPLGFLLTKVDLAQEDNVPNKNPDVAVFAFDSPLASIRKVLDAGQCALVLLEGNAPKPDSFYNRNVLFGNLK